MKFRDVLVQDAKGKDAKEDTKGPKKDKEDTRGTTKGKGGKAAAAIHSFIHWITALHPRSGVLRIEIMGPLLFLEPQELSNSPLGRFLVPLS